MYVLDTIAASKLLYKSITSKCFFMCVCVHWIRILSVRFTPLFQSAQYAVSNYRYYVAQQVAAVCFMLNFQKMMCEGYCNDEISGMANVLFTGNVLVNFPRKCFRLSFLPSCNLGNMQGVRIAFWYLRVKVSKTWDAGAMRQKGPESLRIMEGPQKPGTK